ncbi:MAG: proteasome accessory factor PafA2 family protein [Planctomycetes bacterium]|nr:proteasome accessory factor PafA2 family protein [Planctomycetota bacterium]
MADRLFGMETEYALTAFGRRAIRREEVISHILRDIAARHAHLPRPGPTGMFFANGGSFYIDYGSHPEMATPECTTPTDLVRYVLAGEKILSDAADRVAAETGASEIGIFRSNVDYGGTFSTWGCHESYMHRVSSRVLGAALIPHLVSRIIYCGAGGFDPTSPGIRFLLSPRTAFIGNVSSANSTADRGIIHTKNEALATGGYLRCHLLCGETLCAEAATWLKVASTALVVALVDARGEDPFGLRLRCPVGAFRSFAADPSLQATAPANRREALTAIEVQEHYLDGIASHLGDPGLPSWAEEACRVWRAVLAALRDDPARLAASHDAHIKRALFEHVLASEGWSWDDVAAWNERMGRVVEKLSAVGLGGGLRVQRVLAAAGRGRDMHEAFLRECAASTGLVWEDLLGFLRLRARLMEIDTRFGQLGPRGIFCAMAADGGLPGAHVPGVDRIDEAVATPPAAGRAHVRGEAVKMLHAAGNRCLCDWPSIQDAAGHRWLDLRDPFETEMRWQEMPKLPGIRPEPLAAAIFSQRILRAEDECFEAEEEPW